MSTNHTPGPWTFGYVGTYGYCITTIGGTHIATSILYKKDGGEANARLIAAAPELLGALLEADEWVSEYVTQMSAYTISDKARECRQRIQAAIAKATGSSQ